MSRMSSISVVVVGAVLGSGLSVVAAEAASVSPRSGAAPVVTNPAAPVVRAAPRPEPVAATDVTDVRWRSPQDAPEPSAGTYVVDLPASGRARAGGSPIAVGRSAKARDVSRVRVRTLSGDEVRALGGRFVAFEVVRADRGAVAAPVSLALDYGAFERAFGGDFALRLRIVERRACAVVRPDDPACEGFSVVRTRNDITGNVLTADLTAAADPETATAPTSPSYESDSGFGPQAGAEEPLDVSLTPDAGDSTVMTMSSTSSGQTGDYKATPFQPSNQWQVGVSSGGFSYSYPLPLPPPVAGVSPSLSFNYSSQSVDGRTSSSHAQVSQAGQGWSFDTGYIERRFASCTDDGMGSSNGDLCWKSTNEYFLNFNGRSDQIFRYGATNEWRLRDDPAWRILSFTGAPNGDNDGEYFVVITPNGTKHWFGSGTEAGGLTPRYTNSTYTVPVTAGSNEPCYSAVSATSWCQQAWRWNIDRSQDTNDNVVSYFYAKETNYYLRAGATTATEYVRGGYPTRIEYSSRAGSETGNDPSVVVIDTAGRCVSETTACPAASPSTANDYPDVPTDLICTSATSCSTTDHRSPTFFSDRKVSSIRTWIHNGTAYDEVTRLDFDYSFPDHTDGTDPSLWLQSITRTGKYGGSIPLPPVKFTGTLLTNRVNYDATAGVPATKKFRVGAVTTELGGKATVTYDDPYPCSGSALPQWDLNETDCFPQWTTVDGSAPGWVAFRKYLVTKLVVDDTTGPSPSMTTQYVYLDKPAWHHDNSILTPTDRQSWSQYRGHAYVQVIGDPTGATARTEQRHMTFRGMHADKLSNGTTRSVSLTDSTGTTITDDHYLQGYPLETRTYESGGGHTASKLHRYWRVATITGPTGTPRHDTVYVRESSSINRVKDTASALGTWRTHEVRTTYDSSYANPIRVVDHGDAAAADDESCTDIAYAANVATSTTSVGANAWLVNYPHRRAVFNAATCGGTSTEIARTETLYDGQSTVGVPPIDGNVTESRAHSTSTTKSVTRFSYDAYGRVTKVVSPNVVDRSGTEATTTAYSPTTGYPINGVTVKNAKEHTVTTKTFPAWGTVASVKDPNGFTTSVSADPLGRTVAVHKPGDDADKPSLKFDYALSQSAPSNVSTRRLISGGRYVLDGAYLDSVGRVVQTETHEPNGSATGRLLTQTRYDAQGRVAAETDPFGNGDNLGGGVGLTQPTTFLETRYAYDSAGRRSRAARYAGGVEQFATVTRHHGTWHQVDAPVHTDVDYRTDSWGRVWKITERPSGTTSDTLYEYTPFGNLSKITDDKNAVTSYTYDWLRRRTRSLDADAGEWLYGYDLDGNLTNTRDAELKTTVDVYDVLGRRTSRHVGTATGTKLSEWTYDTATNGTGLLASATRLVSADKYTQFVSAYDNRGRVTSRATVIPTSLGFTEHTYAYSYTYDAGDLVSVAMPGGGGLAPETVTTGYNNAGRPITLTGTDTYVGATQFDSAGRLLNRTINTGLAGVVRTFGYDNVGRLNAIDTVQGARVIEDIAYTHDSDSNLTSIVDTSDPTKPENECFRYGDGVNRLTRAWVTDAPCSTGTPNTNATLDTAPYDLTYTYDSVGNMTSGQSGTATPTEYTYGDPVHAHAAKKIGSTTYTYDKNGAVVTATAGPYTALKWDEAHQLSEVTAGANSSTFTYDADGTRLIRKTGDVTTLYVEGMEFRHKVAEPAGLVSATRYYGTTAVRDSADAGVTSLLRNHQGSPNIALDSRGHVLRKKYLPYGGVRAASAFPTERGFLDGTTDSSDLVHLGARYFDGTTGRFISPDPLLNLQRPQAVAAYTYGRGNPTTFVDPSGLEPYKFDDGTWGGFGCADGGCATSGESTKLATQASAVADAEADNRLLTTLSTNLQQKRTNPASYWRNVYGSCNGSLAGNGGNGGGCERRWIDRELTLALDPPGSNPDWMRACATGSSAACMNLINEAAELTFDARFMMLPAIVRAGTTSTGTDLITFGPGTQRAWEIVDRARTVGRPFAGTKGGRPFRNREKILPRFTPDGAPITYREWDVYPYVRGINRGQVRIVTGSDGSAYYTEMHYQSFLQFSGPPA